MPYIPPRRGFILEDVQTARAAQDLKHGGSIHDQCHTPYDWIRLIQDQLDKVKDNISNPAEYRYRLLQVAATAVAAIEVHDGR